MIHRSLQSLSEDVIGEDFVCNRCYRPLYAIQLSDLSFETGKKAFNLIGRGQRSLLPIHISYRIHNRSETHVK